MERLTIDEIIEHCDRKTEMYEKTCDVKYLETTVMNNPIKGYWEHKQVAEYLRKLKAYENLEEQGRLVKLPCKVGDTVYAIGFDNKPIIYMSDEELAESNLCPHMVNWKKETMIRASIRTIKMHVKMYVRLASIGSGIGALI